MTGTDFIFIVFLSRLCGGEAKELRRRSAKEFLSRLCGGEAQLIKARIVFIFLSRLCGGEANPF